jgi:chemotaxis protein histidine kinase CheA
MGKKKKAKAQNQAEHQADNQGEEVTENAPEGEQENEEQVQPADQEDHRDRADEEEEDRRGGEEEEEAEADQLDALKQQKEEEEARKRQEEEEARKRQEEEARRKQQEQEEARKRQEEEEARKKQQEQEEARKRQEEEEALRKQQEQEEARKRQEEEEAHRREEAAKKPSSFLDEVENNPWSASATQEVQDDGPFDQIDTPSDLRPRNASAAVMPVESEEIFGEDNFPSVRTTNVTNNPLSPGHSLQRPMSSNSSISPNSIAVSSAASVSSTTGVRSYSAGGSTMSASDENYELTGVKISVVDSQEAPKGTPEAILFSHTVYEIRVTLLRPLAVYKNTGAREFSVRRRYNQFETLCSQLRNVHPEIVIPPLPEKNFFGRFAEDTIKERLSGFNEILHTVSTNQTLAYSPFVLHFLGVTDTIPAELLPKDPSIFQLLETMAGDLLDLIVEGVDKTTNLFTSAFKSEPTSNERIMNQNQENL